MKTLNAGRLVAAAVLAAGLAQSAAAQAPAAPAVVELPEFAVTTDASRGWAPTNMLSGTRTNVELMNLPRTAQVLTEEFLADIGALSLADSIDYVSNVVNVGSNDSVFDNNSFNMRGFLQRRHYRNGYREFFPISVDSAVITRVEVLKGPTSLLTGISQPGGVVNYITKRPQTQTRTQARVMVGSWNHVRAELDTTGPVGSQFSYRLVGVYEERDGWREWERVEKKVFFPVVTWRPLEGTSVTLEMEYQDYLSNPPTAVLGVNGNRAYAEGRVVPWDFNLSGPDSFREQELAVYRGELQQRLGEIFTFRGGFNYVDTTRRDRRPQSVGQFADAANTRINWQSTDDREINKTLVLQADLVAKFNWHPEVAHVATLGYETVDIGQDRVRFDNRQRTPFIFGSPTNNFSVGRFPQDFALLNTITRSDIDREGFTLINQISALAERVQILYGIRRDEAFGLQRNRVNNTQQVIDETATVQTVGLGFRPRPWITFYGSWSESFDQAPLGTDFFGNFFEPESGQGWDLGVKVSAEQTRVGLVSANVAIFGIDRENVLRFDTDNPGFSRQSGAEKSSGAELDVLWQPVPAYQLAAGVGYTTAETVRDEGRPRFEGRPVPGLGNWNASLFHAYTFGDGPLEGLSVNQGIIYVDRRVFDLVPATGEVLRWVPAYTRVDVGIGYATKLFGADALLRLTVENVLDERYYAGAQTRGSPRAVRFSVRTTW